MRQNTMLPLGLPQGMGLAFGRAAKPFRVGVYIGSFNPIHKGHLKLGEQARDQFKLDAVEFVTLARPVHKQVDFMDDEVRHRLNELAVKGRPKLFASRLDVDAASPTLSEFQKRYPAEQAKLKLVLTRTLNLLQALKTKYRKLTQRPVELNYLVGIDGLAGYPQAWTTPEYGELVRKVRFLVAPRPGGDSIRKVARAIRAVQPQFRHAVLKMLPMDISSTRIRQLLQAGQPISDRWVPQAVADFLNQGRQWLLSQKAA